MLVVVNDGTPIVAKNPRPQRNFCIKLGSRLGDDTLSKICYLKSYFLSTAEELVVVELNLIKLGKKICRGARMKGVQPLFLHLNFSMKSCSWYCVREMK